MTSRKIVVETTVRKIDIDWERVYSGFVASGLSLREFHRLHLQCFFPGTSLPALSSLARHMRLIRQRHQGQMQQFSDSCDVIENVLTQASATPTELSSDTSLITLDEQQFALLTSQAENVGTEVAASSLSCSGALSVFLPGGLRLEMQIGNPAVFIAQLSCAMKKNSVAGTAS